MGCPYYQDFTRTCIQSFPKVIQHSDFIICESEAYRHCLAYFVLQKDFRCKYQNLCLEMMAEDIPWILKFFIEDEKVKNYFRKAVDTYCSSKEHHVLCANYRLLEQGIKPPLELMPDGRKLLFRDILLKKELTIE